MLSDIHSKGFILGKIREQDIIVDLECDHHNVYYTEFTEAMEMVAYDEQRHRVKYIENDLDAVCRIIMKLLKEPKILSIKACTDFYFEIKRIYQYRD